MRIAYISYEHPAGISGGGIGTYIGQISASMARQNHSVEVFSGTLQNNALKIDLDGYILHLIPANSNLEFRNRVLPFFSKRHAELPFDIIESAEYGADGLEIKKAFPALPLTLKLHTPSFLIWKLNEHKNAITDKLRFIVGGLIKLKIVKPYWTYYKKEDPEYELFKLANTVSSPSVSLAKIVEAKWGINADIQIIPNLFENSDKVFKPVTINSNIIITFIGKLEKRKGILDLMNSIPLILKLFPHTIFRFIGRPSPSPYLHMDMTTYIKKKLTKYAGSLEFFGYQPHDKVITLIEDSHICVFPSLWENFPNVCLEAMSVGRAVIGTDNGGMADIIKHDFNGILIKPNSPKGIFNAVKTLINNPDKITTLGNNARKTVSTLYNGNIIGQQIEDLYLKTISHK